MERMVYRRKSHILILEGMYLFLVLLAVGGCTRKTVYVPPEWARTQPQPQPQAEPSGKGRSLAPLQPPEPVQESASGPGAILSPPPAIKEREVSPQIEPSEPQAPERKPEPPQPQHLASMHLVDQAKTSLSQGKADVAISLYEKAVQVDAHNGEAWLGLGRAWRMKGSRNKALEFARKAEILLQEEPAKMKEVYLFQADLYKELGDVKKSELFRQKASRL
jgi:hypothetical protein